MVLGAHLLHRTDLGINVAPRLAVQSPTMRSGKSTTLEIVHNLTPRPVIAGSITTSSLFRIVEAEKPTLLIDEADNVVRKDSSPDLPGRPQFRASSLDGLRHA